ncbi:uncharacterized protein ATNIH1004_011777 [Aspergillus tanneri]|uniref:Uncharacterized protein n=1 Tax=Aspergillus tanneri TaxID=1220188 RepID=A0A5M9M4K9_9EURO|nr:uncharacterized protein ATNIH1004_011777 [Aspergillus tanneri]KAA8641641.1 hypothetical protein ATNIH1004_011777 [Aspergillus tanneri]
MGLSQSKAVIDKVIVASTRASYEGRQDIQEILSDNEFVDNLHGLWQQVPYPFQNRIAPVRQSKVTCPSRFINHKKNSATSMLAAYRRKGYLASYKAVTRYRKQRPENPTVAAYKVKKHLAFHQTGGHHQKKKHAKFRNRIKSSHTTRNSQKQRPADVTSDNLQQLIDDVRQWRSNIPGFFHEEGTTELSFHNPLAGTYKLLKQLEQRNVRDEMRIRLLKVMFHRLLEKVCNQYARSKDIKRVIRVIAISGLVDDNSEQIEDCIKSWGKSGRRLDCLCKDLSDGDTRNERHLGKLFLLPKNITSNYLEKLGYKSRNRLQAIERLKNSGIRTDKLYEDIDEFAGCVFLYLWKRVEEAITQESLPVGQQLQGNSTGFERASCQTVSSDEVATELATQSSVQRTSQSDIGLHDAVGTPFQTQPALSSHSPANQSAAVDLSNLVQPLTSDMEPHLSAVMPGQREADIWPLMQRISIPASTVVQYGSGSAGMQPTSNHQFPTNNCPSFPQPYIEPLGTDMEPHLSGVMPNQMEADIWPLMQRIPIPASSNIDYYNQPMETQPTSSNPYVQPLGAHTEQHLDGAMPDQMQVDIWPFMQRIHTCTTAEVGEGMITTTQQGFNQGSVPQHENSSDTDTQLRATQNYPHCSLLSSRERAQCLDSSQRSDPSSNTLAASHVASEQQSSLDGQHSGLPYCEVDRYISNNQYGNYHYIPPATTIGA